MADVVPVSMPFGPVFAPSLGLSLLTAGLARHGVDAAIHYFTISFADAIGQNFYCGIADGDRPALEDMAGEWLFGRALFESTPADDARYVDEQLRGHYSDALISRVLRARDQIDPFLDRCLETVLAEEPRLVGFTSIFQQHAASRALAQTSQGGAAVDLCCSRRRELRRGDGSRDGPFISVHRRSGIRRGGPRVSGTGATRPAR